MEFILCLSSGRGATAINIHKACEEFEARGNNGSVENVRIDFSFHLTGICQPASQTYSNPEGSFPITGACYQLSLLPTQTPFSSSLTPGIKQPCAVLCATASGRLPTPLIVGEVDNLAVFSPFLSSHQKDVAECRMLKLAFFLPSGAGCSEVTIFNIKV